MSEDSGSRFESVGNVLFVVALIVAFIIYNAASASTQETLKLLVCFGPFIGLMIFGVILIFWLLSKQVARSSTPPSLRPSETFTMMALLGVLCMLVDYFRVTPSEPFAMWMPFVGTLGAALAAIVLGAFSLEGSPEDSAIAWLVGAPVGALWTGLLLLLFG